tara:strand:- start:16303 stop:16926 length:624 start_codon:yes stop_codon:yes gene_type:complete
MERHSKGVVKNPCYAHIFFTEVPERIDYENISDVLSIDVVTDQSPLENLRGISNYEPRFAGVVWSLTPDIQADIGVSVTKIHHWDSRPQDFIPTYGGIKQISFVSKRHNLDTDTFHARYLAHASIAREHHGMQAYAQNFDIDIIYGSYPNGFEFNAISELWFATSEDWNERFYLDVSSPEVVRRDTETFIDFGKTQSAIVAEIANRE